MQSISNTMPISLKPASRRITVESAINPLPVNTLERPSRHPDRLLRGECPLSFISCRLKAVTFRSNPKIAAPRDREQVIEFGLVQEHES